MSNHRITIIALFSALALTATPFVTAQTSAPTNTQDQEPATAAASSTAANQPGSTTEPADTSSTSEPSSTPNASATSAGSTGATSTNSEPASTTTTTASPQSDDTSPKQAQLNAAASPATPTSATDTAVVGQTAGASDSVQRVIDEKSHTTFGALKGKRLRGPDGSELGKIHDFVLDASSGKIVHVVVSTGGVLGVGDKLRLLPGESVKREGEDGFTADMPQSEFRALPTIAQKELEEGRIAAQSDAAGEKTTSESTASASTKSFVRASELDDRSIRSDDTEIGEIEQVVVDLQKHTAMAMIEADASFAGESGKYLVPFSKLEVRSGETDAITSSLMRSDFPSAQSSASGGIAASSTTSTTSASTSEISASSGTTPTADGQSGRSEPSSGIASSASSPASGTTPSASDVAGTRSTSSTESDPTSPASVTPSSSSATDVASSSPSTSASSEFSSSTAGRSQTDTSSTPAAAPGTSSPTDYSAIARDDGSRGIQGTAAASSTRASEPGSSADARQQAATGDSANASSTLASSPSSVTDEQLTPTGRTSAEQGPASAMAIRQALDGDATLARENVQVTTKIILRGTVESEEAKNRAEELAKQAAGSTEIDNQITVQQK